MGIRSNRHAVNVSLIKTTFTEHGNGTDLKLLARVSCCEFCDLRGKKVTLIGKSGDEKEIELTNFNGVENETDEINVITGNEPGEYTWKAFFHEQEQEEKRIIHGEGSFEFAFPYYPHSIGIAVWDLLDAVQICATFKVKVGIKCSTQCNLAGHKLEIYNQDGALAVSENLGEVPWRDTGALYWIEVELKAPDTEGNYTWQVKYLDNVEDEVQHQAKSTSFSFKVMNPPECVVTVIALDKVDKTPLQNVAVILHPYKARTDENGMAQFEVAKGEYSLYVTGDTKYEVFRSSASVNGDRTIKAELVVPPVQVEDF